MKKIIQYWLPVAGWAGIIFWLSSIPELNSGLEEDFALRKTAHMFEYFVLMWLLWRAYKMTTDVTQTGQTVYPLLITLLYACSNEFHQTFVTGRHGTWVDVLIDATGIVVFFVVKTMFTRAI